MASEITSISELLNGGSVLAWVSYPPSSSSAFCFAYPQWLRRGGSFDPVSPMAIPDRGSVFVSIQGGDDAGSIRAKYGEIVVATINANDIYNRNYDGFDYPDQYFAMLNERYVGSEIEFARIGEHPAGRDLVQIVELDDPGISLDSPLDKPVGLRTDLPAPVTQWVMVERVEGTKIAYYGPFTAQPTASGEFELNAVPEFRKKIHRIDSGSIGEIVSVNKTYDDFGTAVKFVTRSKLAPFQNKLTAATAIDWITDEELIEAISNVLKNTRGLNIKPAEIRTIKRAIENCTMETARIYMTDQRRRRMEELLSQPELWQDRVDVLASALARPQASEKLIELALSETYFPHLKELFVDSEAIQEQIAAETRKLSIETEKARQATAAAIAAKEEAERQLAEGQEKVRAMRDEALAGLENELAETQNRLAEAQADLAQAEGELKAVDEQAERLLSKLDAGAAEIAHKVAKSRVLRRLQGEASPVGGELVSQEKPNRAMPAPRGDEADMKPHDVIDALHEQIVEKAGRDMSHDQVINLLTCVMGSSITVLSGLPGTGKTSLANILAGALGLTQPQAPRYTKISVERGWTSHRDYIGYYNPLSKTLEASNAAVFESVLALDEERRAAGTDSGLTDASVPHLILLDEANLSVVENYWSPLLGNADEFLVKPASLNMQGSRNLELPVNVRWIATVNFDHTTEALSDRFLNRAWVISIGADNLTIDDLLNSSDAYDFSDVEPFSYRKLMEVFGPDEEARIEDMGAKRLLSTFFAKCKAGGSPVSYRCQRAIARYVATAEPLMREFGSSAGTRAADFAISQRVLPAINGDEEARRLLCELRELSPALEATNALISHMIEAGDADGYYQFFA